MSDERFVIPTPPEPEPIDRRPHPEKIRVDRLALVVAAAAALFSFLQWIANVEQVHVAEEALNLASRTSENQAKDVERSRLAAEGSASAAQTLAEAALEGLKMSKRSADAAEASAAAGREALQVSRALGKLDLHPSIRVFSDLSPKSGEPRISLTNTGPVAAIDLTMELMFVGYDARNKQFLAKMGGFFPPTHLENPVKPSETVSIPVSKASLDYRFLMVIRPGADPQDGKYNDILEIAVRYHREVDHREYGGKRFNFRVPSGEWTRENQGFFPTEVLEDLVNRHIPKLPEGGFELHPLQ